MFLKQLNLTNYKNYEHLSIDLCEKLNCFVGLNGMGKTNLLDAIYYLSYCKSFFTSLDQNNVSHDADFFMIEGVYNIADEEDWINCGVKIGEKKTFKKNKKAYTRLSDHIGLIPLVFVAPQDHVLITASSEVRRKFIDGIISQIDRVFLETLIKFKRVLQHRNALLKNFSDGSYFDADSLEIWDSQLIELSSIIHSKRKEFIESFRHELIKAYTQLGKESVDLRYESSMNDSSLEELLQSSVKQDVKRGSTSFGPHRDDFLFILKDKPIKKYGSQGQQKSYLLGLKLAQYVYLSEEKNVKPLLLLDDIFDKLDALRVEALLNFVGDSKKVGQVFITDTNLDRVKRISESLGLKNSIFEIEDGNLKGKIEA